MPFLHYNATKGEYLKRKQRPTSVSVAFGFCVSSATERATSAQYSVVHARLGAIANAYHSCESSCWISRRMTSPSDVADVPVKAKSTKYSTRLPVYAGTWK